MAKAMTDWRNEWTVAIATGTKRERDREYKRLSKMYGSKNVRKVDRKKYIIFGDNLPYLVKIRRGARYS